jgi:hypothetical protein
MHYHRTRKCKRQRRIRSLTEELQTLGDADLCDWICSCALLGPVSPVRRIARHTGLSTYLVSRIVETHRDDFIARNKNCPHFRAAFNPAPKRSSTAVVREFREYLLAASDHGDGCVYWPYRGRKALRWSLLKQQHRAGPRTHRIELTCGDQHCVNRSHLRAVPRAVPQPKVVEPDRSDPLLRAWR